MNSKKLMSSSPVDCSPASISPISSTTTSSSRPLGNFNTHYPILISALISALLPSVIYEHKKNHPILMMIFFVLGIALMVKLTHGSVT